MLRKEADNVDAIATFSKVGPNYFLFFLSNFFLEFGLSREDAEGVEVSSSSSSSELPLSPG